MGGAWMGGAWYGEDEVEAESIHGKNLPKAVSLTLLFKKHPTLSD